MVEEVGADHRPADAADHPGLAVAPGEGPGVGVQAGVALVVGVGDGAGRRPDARGLEPAMGPARLREEGLRRGHRPQASPPPPLFHAGDGDLQFGPGDHQDGSVQDAVLLGAHELLAVDQLHGAVAEVVQEQARDNPAAYLVDDDAPGCDRLLDFLID